MTTSPSTLQKSSTVIVQQGKVLDFIDGQTQREETPEEYVRQEIAKSLVREYGYPKQDIAVEFILRVGSRKPRADLVVFAADADHAQENSYIVVECKAQTVKASDRKEGVDQLHSYLKAEAIYSKCFPSFQPATNADTGFNITAAEMFKYRRRLDASCFKQITPSVLITGKFTAGTVQSAIVEPP